jgi:hypothetical protein
MISNVFTYYNNLNYSNKSSIYNCYCNKHQQQDGQQTTISTTATNQQNEKPASTSRNFEPPTNSIPIVMNANRTRQMTFTEPNSPINTQNIVDLPSQHHAIPPRLSQSLIKSNIIPIRTTLAIKSSLSNGTSVTSSNSNINNMKNNKQSGLSSNSSSYNSPSQLYTMNGIYANNSELNTRTNDSAIKTLKEESCSNLQVLGSSVPTYCGSYAGVYKRFMRSISNSLISSNGNIHTIGDNTGETKTVDRDNSFNNQINVEQKKNDGDSRRVSLSGMSSNCFVSRWNQTSLCEKCVENNSYPKYKIGVSIMFCLPSRDASSKTTLNTNTSTNSNSSPVQSPSNNATSIGLLSQTPSPLPASQSLASIPFLNNANHPQFTSNKSAMNFPTPASNNNKHLFDPLILFPATSSSSSSPTSPPNSPNSSSFTTQNINKESLSNMNMDGKIDQDQEPTGSNEDFYEFFFSHLPIIEYQFKELRERIIKHLPLYFNSPKYFQQHFHSNNSGNHYHRHSITSQTSNGSETNRSLNSSTLNLMSSGQQHPNMPSGISALSFTKQMLNEFDTFEKKFNLLYHSPRLTCPAWLSLINTKRGQCNQNSDKRSNSRTSAVTEPQLSPLNNINKRNIINISNNLISDLSYLNMLSETVTASGASKLALTPLKTPNSNPTTESYFSHIFQNIKNSFSQSSIGGGGGDSSSVSSSLTASHNNGPTLNSLFDSSTTITAPGGKPSNFLSTLLSTILKYHLSWVYTVLPSNDIATNGDSEIDDPSNNLNNLKTKLRKQRANWTNILKKTNPYNPLWAQLSDLHGACNQPLKLVRTVVIGRDREMCERVLFFLSYFIRCGNSSYFDIIQENFDFNKLINPLVDDLNLSEQLWNTEEDESSAGGTNLHHLSATKTLAENSLVTNTSTSSNASTGSNSREIDLADLKDDPIAQLSLIIGSHDTKSHKVRDKLINDTAETHLTTSSVSPPANVANTTASTCSSSSPFSSTQKTKKRHVSSNSNGMNCSAQELPLIGQVFLLDNLILKKYFII